MGSCLIGSCALVEAWISFPSESVCANYLVKFYIVVMELDVLLRLAALMNHMSY